MSHGERCPVCNGAGRVPAFDPGMASNTVPPQPVVCHGCQGRGWISVPDLGEAMALRGGAQGIAASAANPALPSGPAAPPPPPLHAAGGPEASPIERHVAVYNGARFVLSPALARRLEESGTLRARIIEWTTVGGERQPHLLEVLAVGIGPLIVSEPSAEE